MRAERSKRLQKLRGELCERSFAHCYETGAMRRLYVRSTDNVLKRVLVQAAEFNIGLLLRTLSGWGTPRLSRRAVADEGWTRRQRIGSSKVSLSRSALPFGLQLVFSLLLPRRTRSFFMRR